MSTVAIITALIVLLATLVCYAFVYQTLQHKKEKRTRLLAALKARARSFTFMLNGCPDGFLPKELTVLVQRSLVEVLEQLTRLEPEEKKHGQDLHAVSTALAESQHQGRPSSKSVSLQNPQQIKEARACLEELHRFIFQQEARKTLARNQAEAYRNQIKQLVLQITVDGYALNGRTAKQKDKPKLALHYYDLALNLLIREKRSAENQASIDRLKAITDELRQTLAEQEESEPSLEPSADPESSEEWTKFDDNESTWKKKNVYD